MQVDRTRPIIINHFSYDFDVQEGDLILRGAELADRAQERGTPPEEQRTQVQVS